MTKRVAFTLATPDDRAKAVRLVNGVSAGSRFELKAPRRSTDQNDKMWAMLTDISNQVEWHGHKLSPDDYKCLFTAGLRKAFVVPDLEGTGFVMLGLRTSDMSVAEMSDLIELMLAFGAERGVQWTGEAA